MELIQTDRRTGKERRSGADRRQADTAETDGPERRSGKERRHQPDRRRYKRTVVLL